MLRLASKVDAIKDSLANDEEKVILVLTTYKKLKLFMGDFRMFLQSNSQLLKKFISY